MKKIAIIHVGGLGDLLISLPAFHLLRTIFPVDTLHLYCHDDKISLFEKENIFNNLIPAIKIYSNLEKIKYDIIINFAGLDKKLHYNLQNNTRIVSSHSFNAQLHASKNSYNFIQNNFKKSTKNINDFLLHLNSDEVESAINIIGKTNVYSDKIIIALHPGSGDYRKTWNRESFINVINILSQQQKIFFIITIGPLEKEFISDIINLKHNNFLIINNKNLRIVANIISLCKVIICGDSGIMHLASAVKVPSIAIFGPSAPSFWGPINSDSIIIKSRTNCTCSKNKYINCKHRNCLNYTTPLEVSTIVKNFLKNVNVEENLCIPYCSY